jgi:hypothetical protein
MLEKFRQLECAQGFVHLMYNLLEMLGRVMEFMLLSGGVLCGNGLRLLPVRTLNPLIMQRRIYRRRWISWDVSSAGRTRYLNPARRSSPWSPFSE